MCKVGHRDGTTTMRHLHPGYEWKLVRSIGWRDVQYDSKTWCWGQTCPRGNLLFTPPLLSRGVLGFPCHSWSFVLYISLSNMLFRLLIILGAQLVVRGSLSMLRFIPLDNGAILGTPVASTVSANTKTLSCMPAENHIKHNCLSNKEVCLPRFDRISSPRSGDRAEWLEHPAFDTYV